MAAPAFDITLRLRTVDVDLAGLVAFVRRGNHCACDAVRHGGAVVRQTSGFDGPHECRAYHVIREADGAVVESVEEREPSQLCHETGRPQGFDFWRGGVCAESDEEIAAALLANVAHGVGLCADRYGIAPHGDGHCTACL